MRRSAIAFGLFFSIVLTSVQANTVGEKDTNPIRKINTSSVNIAPIIKAIAQNDTNTVASFIALGTDIKVKSKIMKMTPLMFAARYNNVVILKLLVAKGAKINEKSKIGITALEYATHANATDAVEYLKSISK